MAKASTNPTILVKKADGTSVRLPLSEVLKSKKEAPVQKVAKTEPPAQSKNRQMPPDASAQPVSTPPGQAAVKKSMSLLPAALPENLPAVPISLKKPASSSTPEDFTSLLEEETPVAPPNALVTTLKPDSRLDQVEELIKKLSFTPPPATLNRLRTAIQLLLKDVRTPEQTQAILVRSPADGGVGLNPATAKEIIGLVAQRPTAAAPVKSGSALPKAAQEITHSNVSGSLSQKAEPQDGSLRLNAALRPTPTVNDISARPFELTPVDEIRYITLTDFRRSSGNPTDAALRLEQKFNNIRDESIVSYLEALEAWRQAPLYTAYLTRVGVALAGGKTIAEPTVDAATIQFNEIQALISMEERLPYL